jgi:histidinol-phosphatase
MPDAPESPADPARKSVDAPAGAQDALDDPAFDDLALALRLADAADAITMARFLAVDLVVETKPDLTPVTDADRAVERELRRSLAERRPGDAVLGEEFGEAASGGSRRWVLDPVDGTKNFVRGVPVWATLLALMDGPEVYVGVVSAPALGRRWWACRGRGAWTRALGGEPRRLRVSAVSDLADASVSSSGLGGWLDQGRLDQFLALAGRVWRTRGYGDFWSHTLVAEGAVDIAAEPEVSLWDLAAVAVLVEEAGGRFTDLAGRPGPDGGSAVATNGLLHDAVLAVLG